MRHFKLWAGYDGSKNNIFTRAEKEIPACMLLPANTIITFDMIFLDKSKIERLKRSSILRQFYGDLKITPLLRLRLSYTTF